LKEKYICSFGNTENKKKKGRKKQILKVSITAGSGITWHFLQERTKAPSPVSRRVPSLEAAMERGGGHRPAPAPGAGV